MRSPAAAVDLDGAADELSSEARARALKAESLFFVERSILRDSEFCRIGGAMNALKEAQELFAAVLTLAPKSSVRLRRGNEVFAEARYGNVIRHDPPRSLNLW